MGRAALGRGIALAIRADRTLAVRFLVCTVLVGIAPVAVAWCTKSVLDGLQHGVSVRVLAYPIAGLALGAILAGALSEIIQFDKRQLDRAARMSGQEQIFAAVSRLPGIARFEDPTFLDRLSLAIGMGRQAPARLLEGSLALVQAGLTVTGFVVALIYSSPTMAVLVGLSVVPMFVSEWIYSRRRVRLFEDNSHAQRREMFYGQLLSEPRAAQEIRLFGLADYLRGLMRRETDKIVSSERDLDRRETTLQTAFAVVGAVIAACGLWWAVAEASSGRATVGDVTLFVAGVAGVQSGVASLVGMAGSVRESCLVLRSYTDILASEPDLPLSPHPKAIASLADGIRFEDVWFRYSDDGPWVLRGVNLFVAAQASTALVGPNGAGKSTVVKLLCRLYDPTRGRITWDGVDLKDLDPDELRLKISAVFQDFMHYDLTATQNIAMGDLSALTDPVRVRAASRTAGIDARLAALPHGYDTLLSRMYTSEADKDDPSTGIVLSGGQWQRVALARAFVRTASDIVILDEPSSGLDAEAEEELIRALAQHSRGRATVHISHRMGTLRSCDSIIVLEGGEVAESGTHEVLMDRGGTYARLFDLQARGYSSAHELVAEEVS